MEMGRYGANAYGVPGISRGRCVEKQKSTEAVSMCAVVHLFVKGLTRLEGDGEARWMPGGRVNTRIQRTESHYDVA